MPDNNGNLQKQDVYIPGNDQISSYSMWWQQYSYDSLNRLTQVYEHTSSDWQQTYSYDRFGNRTIDYNNTSANIPRPQFSVDASNNRLAIPSGYGGTMHYDAAGNLDVDTYSAAAVSRLYDAENRMTKETQASSYVAGEYSYDGDGRRVKRKVGSVETWQVYGVGGELLAEYGANTSYTTPQKEYGYRNGQLLITTTCGSGYGDPPVLHDNPLVVGETIVQARHITELRTAINTLRARESIAAYSWTTSATTSDWITATPILEMRTALDQVLGSPPSGYSSGLASGQAIKAIHIQELRDRLTAAWSIDIRWLVTDQLGTPRMIFDASGSLATVSRHDYLPFGDELFAGIGGRTIGHGYSLGDGARQKFTGYERDNETSLDYAKSRMFGYSAGRFNSPDNFLNSTRPENPASWNLYVYALNNPLKYVDPDGEVERDADGNVIFHKTGEKTEKFKDKEKLKDKDGKDVKINGKSAYVTISWKADVGYVKANDGTRIDASKATTGLKVEITDNKGNIFKEETDAQQGFYDKGGYSNTADCHGTTFASGQVWINNSQVENLMRGDGYREVKGAERVQAGDIGIYSTDGTLSPNTVRHSVSLNGNLNAISKAGIQPLNPNADLGPGPGTAWEPKKNESVKVTIWTQRAKSKN